MKKTYRAYQPDQMLLLPPRLQDWLPEDHLAYFVSELVDELDLTAITSAYEKEGRGQPPYHPVMMTKLLVYGYCVGVFSSRKIAQRLIEDVAFRVLAAGNQPDFRTISDFRQKHLEALSGLFEQVLAMAVEAGALKMGRVAIDGSKVKANASKHKAMSYGRMADKTQQLKEEVRRLLAEAEAVDAEEDERYGKDRRGDELPEELQRRETRIERIREAKRALEERARQAAQAAGKPAQAAQPDEKDQYNFTDPESRMMKGPDGFVQAYNVQIAVDAETQLIVGQLVTQAGNDKKQLQPMVETIAQQSGQKPQQALADNGYCSEGNLEYVEKEGIDAYIATGREKQESAGGTPLRRRLPKGATRVERMRRKLKTKVGAAIYKSRKAIVEPVYGQIKQARGFRQFLLRGLWKTQGEWAFVCLTHNILKFYRMIYGTN